MWIHFYREKNPLAYLATGTSGAAGVEVEGVAGVDSGLAAGGVVLRGPVSKMERVGPVLPAKMVSARLVIMNPAVRMAVTRVRRFAVPRADMKPPPPPPPGPTAEEVYAMASRHANKADFAAFVRNVRKVAWRRISEMYCISLFHWDRSISLMKCRGTASDKKFLIAKGR